MLSLFRTMFPLPSTLHTRSTWRVLVLYTAIAAYLISQLPLILPGALSGTANRIGWQQTELGATNLLLIAAAILAVGLLRRGQIPGAAATLALILLAESALFLLSDAWNMPRGWVALIGGVAISMLLLETQIAVMFAAAALVVVGLSGLQHGGDFNTVDRAEYLTMTVWVLASAALPYAAQVGSRRAQRTLDRAPALHDITAFGDEIARSLFVRTELNTFLENMVESISQQFASVDHAQIYLIQPESSHAILRAATGPVGASLIAQKYALDVGGLSAVGRATLTGTYLLVADYNQDPVRTAHPLLQDIRSELAIPLGTTGNVLGALDVQSTQPHAFDDTDIAVLCAIANQIAMAVDSLQLYESAQRSLRENQALYQQTQTNLREIERLNYQLTGRAWSEYLRLQAESTAMTLDMDTGQMVMDADWTPTLEEAATHRQVITTTYDGQRVVALPILVRNEVVGAMEFELERAGDLPEGALELVTAVSQRLGLAMENRRLFDETQRVAQREALINDIGADLQAATGVDAIIQRAARHLQEALAAQQVTIRLGSPAEAEDRPAQGEAHT